jgi:hypothetical protein
MITAGSSRYAQLVALATVISDCDDVGGSENHSHIQVGRQGKGTEEDKCNVSTPFMLIFLMMTWLRECIVN